MKTVSVIGGGNSAHTLIPLLSKTGMKVNLLTRKPELWSDTINLDYIRPTGEHMDNFKGKIDIISSEPSVVIQEADIIILCLPVHIYRQQLHFIAPYINSKKDVYIGTIFGQGGFNWMTDEIKRIFGLNNVKTFSFGLIPWICRTKEYGHSGIVYGAKPINVAAVDPTTDFNFLNKVLFDKIVFDWFGHGKFKQADNFLSLTMSVDNQILHTSRMHGLDLEYGGKWETWDDIPGFYSEFSEKSALILKGLDEDYSLIREAIRQKFPQKQFTYMIDYIEQDNRTNLKSNKTYLDTFSNSGILANIKPPVIESGGKYVLNFDHRFIKDDVNYGLCIAKSLAQMLGVKTENINKTLIWSQNILGKNIIKNNRLAISKQVLKNKFEFGVPETYGIKNIKSICD